MSERDNNSERSTNVTAAPSSSQIVQNNTLSTPVAIVAILCFFITGIIGGLAIGSASNARDVASQARMEARLAQEDLIMLRAVVRAHGIPAESAGDHE
jgi:p-aminobenzoyl-glutamate transporter AbgT